MHAAQCPPSMELISTLQCDLPEPLCCCAVQVVAFFCSTTSCLIRTSLSWASTRATRRDRTHTRACFLPGLGLGVCLVSCCLVSCWLTGGGLLYNCVQDGLLLCCRRHGAGKASWLVAAVVLFVFVLIRGVTLDDSRLKRCTQAQCFCPQRLQPLHRPFAIALFRGANCRDCLNGFGYLNIAGSQKHPGHGWTKSAVLRTSSAAHDSCRICICIFEHAEWAASTIWRLEFVGSKRIDQANSRMLSARFKPSP